METVRSQQATPSGMLRINAFATAAREILSPLVLEFLRRYPQVQIDLVTEGRLVDVVAEGFDLGVRVADLVPSDMIAVSLGRPQRYAVVGSPVYVEKHAVRASRLTSSITSASVSACRTAPFIGGNSKNMDRRRRST